MSETRTARVADIITWRCGHERTRRNTVGLVKPQCRICSDAHRASYYLQTTKAERYEDRRRRRLPSMIEDTERKLRALHNEAARIGIPVPIAGEPSLNGGRLADRITLA